MVTAATLVISAPTAFGQGYVVFDGYNPANFTNVYLGYGTNVLSGLGTNGPVTFVVDVWTGGYVPPTITVQPGPGIPINNSGNLIVATLRPPVITIPFGNTNAPVLESGCLCTNTTPPDMPVVTVPFQPSAPPTNDDFESSWPLAGRAIEVIESNYGATAETNEPAHDGIPAGASVWFNWTAPYSGVVDLTFTNGGFIGSFRAGVYTGTSLANLQRVSMQQIVPESITPAMPISPLQNVDYRFSAVAGQTYQIAVDGSDGFPVSPITVDAIPAYAPFSLVLQLGTAEVAQSDVTTLVAAGHPVPIDFVTTDINSPIESLEAFAGTNSLGFAPNPPFHFVYQSADTDQGICVYAIGTNANGERVIALPQRLVFRPSNDDFADATIIDAQTVTTNFTVDLSVATAQSGEPRHPDAPARRSVWWKWNPARSMSVRVNAVEDNEGFPIEVFTGSRLGNLSRVADNHATIFKNGWFGDVRFTARTGTTYWIRVDDDRPQPIGTVLPFNQDVLFSLGPASTPLPGEVDFSLYVEPTDANPAMGKKDSAFFPLGRAYMPDGRTPVMNAGALTNVPTGYYVAQLWTGKSPQRLQAASQPQNFYYTTTTNSNPKVPNLAGMFVPALVTLTNAAPGDQIFAQVRVWMQPYEFTEAGQTYESAITNGLSYGASRIFPIRAGSEESGPGLLVGVGNFKLSR